MFKKLKYLILLFLFIIPVHVYPAQQDNIKKQTPLPEIKLPNIENRLEAAEIEKDKVSIVAFLPLKSKSFQTVIDALGNIKSSWSNNVNITLIALDKNLVSSELNTELESKDLQLLFDDEYELIKKFKVFIVPTFFILNQSCLLEKIFIDFNSNTEEKLVNEIEFLIYLKNQLSQT